MTADDLERKTIKELQEISDKLGINHLDLLGHGKQRETWIRAIRDYKADEEYFKKWSQRQVTYPLKTLTIWQPWATLIALGFKQYETRSWPTRYRGLLFIHAAKRPLHKPELQLLGRIAEQFPEIAAALPERDAFPLGAILCRCQLEDCLPDSFLPPITPQEKLLGFFGKGRYAWKLADATDFYIPNVKGAQGVWTYHHTTERKQLIEVK